MVTSEEADSYAIKEDERRANRSLITRAREVETQGWREFGVMEEVSRAGVPGGFQIIITIWVDVWKEGEMGKIQVKSRLCVRGNEERIEIGQIFALTRHLAYLFDTDDFQQMEDSVHGCGEGVSSKWQY